MPAHLSQNVALTSLRFQNEALPTFPRHLLNWNGDNAYSDGIVLTYYRENWSIVRQVIEEELS